MSTATTRQNKQETISVIIVFQEGNLGKHAKTLITMCFIYSYRAYNILCLSNNASVRFSQMLSESWLSRPRAYVISCSARSLTNSLIPFFVFSPQKFIFIR